MLISCRDKYGNECTLPPATAPINLALGKNATQKCTYTSTGNEASNAIDGQIDGPISYTCKDDQPWWSVDLGGIKEIQQIKIYNRLKFGNCQEACQNRLQKFYIRLYEADPEGNDPVVATFYYQEDPIGDELTFDFNGAFARWVRIEIQDTDTWLHVREVEVMGWDITPSNTRRSLFAIQNATHDESENPKINGTNQIDNSFGQQNASTLPGNIDTAVSYCQDKEFILSYSISFSESAHENATKEIFHIVKARNGVQTDLYSAVETNSLSLGSTLVITSTESLNLCSNQLVYKSLITLDVQNVEFNEAFDVFSQNMNIEDPSQESQCREVRELLGFDGDYIDDNEICREFTDTKCEFNEKDGASLYGNLGADAARGGTIKDFQGFDFKEQSFNGFAFQEGGFEGFEFEGFDESGNLTFIDLVTEFETMDDHQRECLTCHFIFTSSSFFTFT